MLLRIESRISWIQSGSSQKLTFVDFVIKRRPPQSKVELVMEDI